MKSKILKAIWLIIWVMVTTQYNFVQADETGQWFSAAWLWYIDGYDVIWTQNNSIDAVWNKPRIIKTIQNAINRVLGILWLIALILCLWWWFQMLTAAGDDSKVKSWTKVLKHAAIGLAVIWLSWLVVTFIFYLINTNAES